MAQMPESLMTDTLATRFARLIAAQGPIPLPIYMGEANAAYYGSRDPLGADFITAPEISQMFGEMVGVWLADVWQRAGSPARLAYVEAGPGRGTLARDALRVAARFGLVPEVHFIETSPVLRGAQAAHFPAAHFHNDTTSLPTDQPLLIVANEFFDALPIRQLVRMAQGWRERMVGLESARFVPMAGNLPMDSAVPPEWRNAEPGAILETNPAAAAIMRDLAQLLSRQGGAGLFIDYGYATPRLGSTLQALRAHAHVDPFADPGLADLTALVDFAALADAAHQGGARISGLASQGDWLRAMGIETRAQTLAQSAPEAVKAALHRLIAPDQMGDLFKVLAIAGAGWPDGLIPPAQP
jgi:NADH dehydrogenase [ubiquinone] 1 alpha subcomplex assembly factor 7